MAMKMPKPTHAITTLMPRPRALLCAESISSKIINNVDTEGECDSDSCSDVYSNEVSFTESHCREIKEEHDKSQLVLDVESHTGNGKKCTF